MKIIVDINQTKILKQRLNLEVSLFRPIPNRTKHAANADVLFGPIYNYRDRISIAIRDSMNDEI